MQSESIIEVKNLYKYFGNVKAVNGISFSIPKGAICGFIGPNGCGKTTTMRMLTTLEIPDQGHIKIKGLDLIEHPETLRGQIGYMPDHFGTYPSLRVIEYLDFFSRAVGLKGKERVKQFKNVVTFTEILNLLDRPVEGLSKGQRQRLSLARALMSKPDILILDEPAAGLDPKARIELRRLLKLLSERGVTVLISSHILTELSDLVNYVLIIANGQLKFSGTFHELQQKQAGIELAQNNIEQSEENITNKKDASLANSNQGIPQYILTVGDGVYSENESIKEELKQKHIQAKQILMESPGVLQLEDNFELQPGVFKFKLNTQASAAHELLKILINQNIAVTEFKKEKADLESAFMAMTQE